MFARRGDEVPGERVAEQRAEDARDEVGHVVFRKVDERNGHDRAVREQPGRQLRSWSRAYRYIANVTALWIEGMAATGLGSPIEVENER